MQTEKRIIDRTEVEFRPDALERLRASGTLDMQQHAAGVQLQALLEACEIAPVGAQDIERPYLDKHVVMGRASDYLHPSATAAVRKKLRLKAEIGSLNWLIVCSVACESLSWAQLLEAGGDRLRRYSERTVGARVREAFDALANAI